MKIIPPLIKEGLGVVDWHRDAGTHHPLPPPLLRRGVIFMPAKDLALGIFLKRLKARFFSRRAGSE
jgi:hypothetical protein